MAGSRPPPSPPSPPIAKDPSQIAGMFDAIATRYDLLNHLLSAGCDRWWRRRAVRALALTGRETVVDLCSGTGDFAVAARAGGAARVIGIDFADAMLRIGLHKVRRVPAGRIALVRGDVTILPIASASVDALTIAFGIRNVEQTANACAEMYRVLRPGGRAAVLEFAVPKTAVIRAGYLWYFRHVLPRIGRLISGHPTAYSYLPASVAAFPAPEQFARALRDLGFSQVSATPLTGGIVYLYVARK